MMFEKIKQILCEEFEIEEEYIVPEANLKRDVFLDSLDFVDFVMSLEDEFEMEVSDEALEDIDTIGDLVKFLEDN